METIKNKVIADVQKWKQRKKRERERDKQKFLEAYSQLKKFHFPDKNNINMEKCFYFPKMFDANGPGTRMTKAAMAVYPVMCARANFERDDWFQLPQEHIAKMAGISVPTVRKGLADLQGCEMTTTNKEGESLTIPLLTLKMSTEGARYFYLYRVAFIRKNMIKLWKGKYFVFFTSIIDGGIWADLLPRAKALYLAMRCAAKQDFELYCLVERDVPFDSVTGQDEYYKCREWDICDTPLAELARRVNCSSNMIKRPMEQLHHYKLVERVGRWFKVYLRPKIQ